MKEQGDQYFNSASKKIFSKGVALFAGIVTLPITTSVGAQIMLERRTLNPFYMSKRPGIGGKDVNYYKFQTLSEDHECDEIRSGSKDDRASRISQIYRDTGIDELPQLINVIKGDIHLVGIRSMDHEHREQAEEERFMSKERLKRYDKAVKVAAALVCPGSVRTKAYATHTKELIVERTQIGIDFVENDSIFEDVKVVRDAGRVVLSNVFNLVRNNQEDVVPIIGNETLIDNMAENTPQAGQLLRVA
jgi:lipopolysaccharide/colanic/teichoic acid biosynthesis glycosyltransferase